MLLSPLAPALTSANLVKPQGQDVFPEIPVGWSLQLCSSTTVISFVTRAQIPNITLKSAAILPYWQCTDIHVLFIPILPRVTDSCRYSGLPA